MYDDKIFGSGIVFGLCKGDDVLKVKFDVVIDKLKVDGMVKLFGFKYFGDIDILMK